MLMLQLSSGLGPQECQLAVGYAFTQLEKEAAKLDVHISLIEAERDELTNSFKSVVVALDGKAEHLLGKSWSGTIQWICQSPLRPRYPRKNWFIGGHILPYQSELPDGEITFSACRSSGAGGQHVNKTNSAIHATHIASGISVKVQAERSQHANKRLAKALIAAKLAEHQQQRQAKTQKLRWQQHHQLERGNPIRTFKGRSFKADPSI